MQGEDVRGSGHFTYRSCPGLSLRSAPLRCTNRNDVIAWIKASFGVDHSLHENVVQPPKLSLEQLQAAMGAFGTSQSPITDFMNMETAMPIASTTFIGNSYDVVYQQGKRASMPSMHDFSRRSSTSSRPERGAKIKPYGSVDLHPAHSAPCNLNLQFRCSSCGLHDHSTDECPLGCLSPPALIHDDITHPLMEETSLELNHETAAMLLHEDDSPMQGTVFDSLFDINGLGSPTVAAINSPGVVNQPPPKVDGARAAAAAASTCGHSSITALACQNEDEVRNGCVDPQQRNLISQEPSQTSFGTQQQIHWGVDSNNNPSQKLEQTFEAWKTVLSGHISENPATIWSTQSADVAGKRWVPPLEALAVLQQLGQMETSLALLEKTRISPVVANLRSHPIREISEAAETVVAKWRTMAVAALETATTNGPHSQQTNAS